MHIPILVFWVSSLTVLAQGQVVSRQIYLPDDTQVCDIARNTPAQTGLSRLWQPLGCAIIDSTVQPMTIAFVDSRNQMIRVLDRTVDPPLLSTAAGNGTKGLADGTGSATTSFSMPYAISTPPITPAPYALVADYGNQCIRNISLVQPSLPSVVTTVACGGLITSPSDTAILPNGDVYIADPMSHSILMYSVSTRVVQRVAGSATGLAGFVDGNGMTTALFNQVSPVCVNQV